MDPYKILGVDRNASDDEIKKAYRALVKKYHPDRYTDAHMKEMASEKLKEVNAAYDEIQRIRQGKTSGGSGYGYTSYSSNPKYNQVRMMIQQNNLHGAEALLDAMGEHDAEWNYLKGVIYLRKGWFDGAKQYFTIAHQMNPGNSEYARAYQSIHQMGGMNTGFYGNNTNMGNCSVCDVCAGAMCLDCLCGSRCC